MTRLRLLLGLAAALVATLVPGAVVGSSSATEPSGTFTKHSYTLPGTEMSRAYWTYVPDGIAPGRPLVVYLHGCNQSAVQAAEAMRFNELAAARKFVVVYPQQNVTPGQSAPYVDGNGVGCWNWFLTDHQSRGAGEPAVIAGITRRVAQQQQSDPRRVYVEGASAGADMAVTLGATYPDIYAAVGVLAGCAYRTCSDTSGTLAYQAMGERARVVPMFVVNGSADPANNLAMAEGLVQSWLGVTDWADNGMNDGTVSRQPVSVRKRYFPPSVRPGQGDTCVHNNSATCPGGAAGFRKNYPTTIETYADRRGCEVLQYWVLHGMSHAQPNAPAGSPYGDPLGPDVTSASYEFFIHHPMAGGCVWAGRAGVVPR